MNVIDNLVNNIPKPLAQKGLEVDLAGVEKASMAVQTFSYGDDSELNLVKFSSKRYVPTERNGEIHLAKGSFLRKKSNDDMEGGYEPLEKYHDIVLISPEGKMYPRRARLAFESLNDSWIVSFARMRTGMTARSLAQQMGRGNQSCTAIVVPPSEFAVRLGLASAFALSADKATVIYGPVRYISERIRNSYLERIRLENHPHSHLECEFTKRVEFASEREYRFTIRTSEQGSSQEAVSMRTPHGRVADITPQGGLLIYLPTLDGTNGIASVPFDD